MITRYSVSCQVPKCGRIFENETDKDIARHFELEHPVVFDCYCKSCRTFLGEHGRVEEGHYCIDCIGLKHIDPDPVEELAKTVHSMVQTEKQKARQLPLTKEVLLIRLHKLGELEDYADPERDHGIADDLLLRYINDREITLAYNHIKKYYA